MHNADAARGDAADGENGRWSVGGLVRAVAVTGGEAIDDEVAGGRAGVREPERREHQVADRAIDRRARHDFDDAARHAEAGVVVAPRRARRRDLHQVRHRASTTKFSQRVLAAIGPGDLAFPAAECVRRCHTVTSRLTASSRTLKSGR